MICIPFQFTCERGKRQAKKECKIEVSMLEWLAVTEIYLMKEDVYDERRVICALNEAVCNEVRRRNHSDRA